MKQTFKPSLLRIAYFFFNKPKINKFLFFTFLFLSFKSEAQLNYLFSSFKKPYQPISEGISPKLEFPQYEIPEEMGTAVLPIGFNFVYNEKTYSKVTINVNGFLSFGYIDPSDPCTSYRYNNLSSGTCSSPPPNSNLALGINGTRPIIAPFWEDLGLHSLNDLVYKISGRAPNRIFTVEWKNAYRNVDNPITPDPLPAGTRRELLSLQVRLYESTNAIEFHYRNQGDEIYPPYDPLVIQFPPYGNYGASIGISSSDCNRDFLSLKSTTATPDLSSISSTTRLNQPPSNQVYRFEPALTRIPKISRNKLCYTDKTVSFNLDPGNVAPGYIFEYAITTSEFPPLSGNFTNDRNVNVGRLSPDTRYFIHARSRYRGSYSQWATDVFKTASPSMNVPYLEDFEGPSPGSGYYGNYLPANFRAQDFLDTLTYGQIPELAYDPTITGELVLYGFPFVNGDITNNNSISNFSGLKNYWNFTPGIRLRRGQKYRLSFRYAGLSNYDYSIASAHLEVRYGTATGLGGMTTGLLFDKADIANNDFADTAIIFTAPRTDVYYFGFHDFGSLDDFGNYSLLILDDISITESNNSSCGKQIPIALNGAINSTGNKLNWSGGKKYLPFTIERSNDGVNFNTIFEPLANNKKLHLRKKVLSPAEIRELSLQNKGSKENCYSLEISYDGKNFKQISKNAKNQNLSIQPNNYLDNNPTSESEAVYYRIYQKDGLGRKTYSNIISLGKKENSVKLYPNPSSGKFNLQLPDGNAFKITVINSNGQTTATYDNVRQSLNFGEELPRGTYIIKLQSGSKITTHKIVKL